MGHYLIINTGSASKKYALYENERCLATAHYELVGSDYELGIKIGEQEKQQAVSAQEYNQSTAAVIRLFIREHLIYDAAMINAVGIRVVHGGRYNTPTLVTPEVIVELDKLAALAPLHNPPAVREIKLLVEELPATPLIAVFDTSFHSTLPDYASTYAIAQNLGDSHVLRRYGFHGISYQSIVRKLHDRKLLPEKLIACHLGSGASITAIKNGQSVETSMGFTPLEGLVMGTRPGDIDVGLILHLQKELKMSAEQMETFLNQQAGLRGLSGKTSDVRELIEMDKAGNPQGRLALDVFCHRLRKYIGAYMAVLGGLDSLVFTATIGERSSYMRNRICHGLEGLGIILDIDKNESLTDEGPIQSSQSQVKIYVLKTDELGQIARETAKLAAQHHAL